MTEVSIIYDEKMLDHAPSGFDPKRPEWTEMVKRRLGDQDEGGMKFTHPERPERLEAIVRSLTERPIFGVTWKNAAPAPRATLSLVHEGKYLDFIESYRGKSGWLSPDTTAVSEGSVDAAQLAAGCACAAVDAAAEGAQRAFALVRPPGHHAHRDRAEGFCIYNNVAIAVEHARKNLGVGRVLIFDWDAHHGNDTQAIFTGDPDVMHVDIHAEAPVYPGSGSLVDTGGSMDRGTIINVPVPPKTGDAIMIEIIEAILVPAAIRFQPDLIVVSAGFDGHCHDLLLNQSERGFAYMTHQMLELADLLTGGRIAFVLEGGYRDALSLSARSVLEVMAGKEPPRPELGGPDPGRGHLQLASIFHNRPVYH